MYISVPHRVGQDALQDKASRESQTTTSLIGRDSTINLQGNQKVPHPTPGVRVLLQIGIHLLSLNACQILLLIWIAFSLSPVVSTSLFFRQLQHSEGSASRLHDMLPVPTPKFTCFTTDC